ncbi:MAG: tRNA lysidine(34) synthetase TilS [Gilliamella sp.]|uniref:tRNA lysidine(34) synthetase TilS n=1 Tax=Gilliamella TaxID=1193503 RepID=UPI000A146699|nr:MULTISPECIES: tRNA lysidine(34) synthetase TilS [Gilliamella]MCO6550322.1 tRNA lysidine(34) synthetase TilS [Gilliamella sp.]MCO6554784.1 tRNA lysidine(34) synthetase TilS [Gilliamella sp.]
MNNQNQITCDEIINQTVFHNIKHHKALLVAYSGGVDSTVLMHVLVKLKQQLLPNLELRAIYIHHGLSSNADNWATHCRQQCQTWQVPIIIEKVRLDPIAGNIEEQARNARYQAIYHHLKDDETLCTAQHLDDQCETFFLALKRGSGPAGLSAMPRENQQHLRPLLTISRSQIETYANKHQLNWIEDESNQDDHYDRNFLRLKVLPILNQRWPHFSQMVARSAELCQQQETLINELLLVEFKQVITEQNQLAIAPLMDYSEYKRNAILRMWFKHNHINMPTRQQITLIWQTVALAKEDANPKFIFNNQQVRRYQNQLYLLALYQDIEQQILNWDLALPLTLPDNVGELQVNYQTDLCCRLPQADEKITVRFHAQGKFQIVNRHGSRSIKKLWQEHNIPPWMRTRIPLIYYNEQLICAVGAFVTEQGKGTQIGFILVKNNL